MIHPIASVIVCINPNDPQHPHVQAQGNKFCTICGSQIALKNRYIPLEKLGSGGFATIYTVLDLKTQTERVLKVLLETSPKARELFKQEAEILQSLRHPAVPIVEPDGYFMLTVGNPPTHQLPCLVMEKINGQTLEDILASYPQGCPEGMVINWFRQAVDILRVLHKRQIIHRDLKPSNLMLRHQTNKLVLIDFGGAKKIRSVSWSQDSSTRLYSPGYSPPEQSQGLDVEPAADFYALGRTMIQLLTGKSPSELTDPLTGDLQWRRLVKVSPEFADLLDELVKEDVRQRPNNAARIQQRLDQSLTRQRQQKSAQSVKPQAQTGSQLMAVLIKSLGTTNQLTRNIWKRSHSLSTNLTHRLVKTNRLLFKFITQLGQACIDTIKAMVFSAIAACVGTTIGFVLAYFSPLGDIVASFLSQQLPQFQNSPITAQAEIIIFASVGLATAWGLKVAGGFGQRQRHYVFSAAIGLCGYILGWLFWLAATPYSQLWGILGLIAVAVAILTLGLNLRSRHSTHAVVTSFGSAIVFASLISLNLFPAIIYHLSPQPSWYDFWVYITFFSFVSITFSFWLAFSYYIVVPCLRWMGWH